jgi:hypothetical protein
MLARMADSHPHLAAVQRELVGSGFAYADEFEAGASISSSAGQNRQRVWLNVSPFLNPKALRARTS